MTTGAQAEGPFEDEIRGYEDADRARPPPLTAVLFVGSSTIRLWPDLSGDFPDVPVLNRGFGGSTIPDVLRVMDRIVLPYRPRAMFFYAGDNDLGTGRSAEQVVRDFQEFVARARAAQPGVRIVFLSIKPSPLRWNLADAMQTANADIRALTENDPGLEYADLFTPMLGADGAPRPELYADDGLHMGPAGYALWRDVIRPFVR